MAEIWGRVRRYDSAKGYGFIAGDDGRDYFFHISTVTGNAPIAQGHRVTFTPGMSTKGPRAGHVVVQAMPSQPDRFFMIRGPEVRGYEIVQVIAEDCWYEAFDPNEAKDGLRDYAISLGANAIVDLHLEKYSKSPYPLWASILGGLLRIPGSMTYYQTMHRFHGRAVVIRRF